VFVSLRLRRLSKRTRSRVEMTGDSEAVESEERIDTPLSR
jgi:hypothetical protein